MAVDSEATSPSIAETEAKANTNVLVIKSGPSSDQANTKTQSSSSSVSSTTSSSGQSQQIHSIDAILGLKAAAAAAAIDKIHQQQQQQHGHPNLIQHAGNNAAAAALLHHQQQQHLYHLNQHFQNYPGNPSVGNPNSNSSQLHHRLHSLYNHQHHDHSGNHSMHHQQQFGRANPFANLVADYQDRQRANLEDEDANNNINSNSDSDIETTSYGEAAVIPNRRGLKRKLKKMPSQHMSANPNSSNADLSAGKINSFAVCFSWTLGPIFLICEGRLTSWNTQQNVWQLLNSLLFVNSAWAFKRIKGEWLMRVLHANFLSNRIHNAYTFAYRTVICVRAGRYSVPYFIKTLHLP